MLNMVFHSSNVIWDLMFMESKKGFIGSDKKYAFLKIEGKRKKVDQVKESSVAVSKAGSF